MLAVLDPRQTPGRESGPEPLRRKRVPVPARAADRSQIINRFLMFAIVVLLVDAFVGDKGLVERLRARRAYQAADSSLNALKARNASLREYARQLREDPSAIESIAREELGLVRPGELLFIIRDAKPQSN
ncbi:MAG: septum formation initiator family protein [Vicinamibacterales bacterium]